MTAEQKKSLVVLKDCAPLVGSIKAGQVADILETARGNSICRRNIARRGRISGENVEISGKWLNEG